jgi:hypothetical protein
MQFPLKLFFWCSIPASKGGETPLCDTRKIYNRIAPAVRDKFVKKGWMYVRHFNNGFGLSWQTTFQTEDKTVVEEYCRRAKIDFEWKEGDKLCTRQVRNPVARHPRTGEMVWFNHATFFHISTLEPGIRSRLLTEYSGELPNNTYYGDGSSIEDWVLDHLRSAYFDEMISFPWQRGDLIMLDNLLTAHGRAPYSGARRILFAMTEPYKRQD